MSDGNPRPQETVCVAGDTTVAVEIITPREVPLGGPRAMTVRRTLPQRRRSLIGAWCFCDHYGPDPVGETGGMDVAPHPHTGLQTVSWLFTGEIRHDDSHGIHEMVRPGEVNLMTAGAGICHSEVSTADTSVLHGVQLWTALPESARHGERRFDHYVPEPVFFDGGHALVFLGSALGSASPVATFTPLLGAEVHLDPGASLDLAVDPTFEHGVLVDTGMITVEGVSVQRSELAYTGVGASVIRLRNPGDSPARTIVLGGTPFTEEVVMWWNFLGRSDEEIRRYRQEWEIHGQRYGSVSGYIGHDPDGLDRLPAPHMPATRIRARSSPAPVARPGEDPYRPVAGSGDSLRARVQSRNTRKKTISAHTRERQKMSELTDKTGASVEVRRVTEAEGTAFAIFLAGSQTPAGSTFYVDRVNRTDGDTDGNARERIFYHTVVGDEFGGRGLAGILVGEALASTRSEGFRVVPVCPFVRSWIPKNEWDGPVRQPTREDAAYVEDHAGE